MKNPSRRTLLTSVGVLVAAVAGIAIGRLSVGTAPSEAVDAPLVGIASVNGEHYVRAIRELGGIPVILPDTDGSADSIDEYLVVLDGLILPGGADIPPSEYGEEPHETVRLLTDDRFLFEKALSKAWIERSDKPLLGICLGAQWINVASGGSLVQDIPSEFDGLSHRDREHPVILEPDSRLSEIFGETEFAVNSSHHQAVKELGKGLRIVARCPDGVVEATETTDPNRFLIGVQWHPEVMMPDNRQEKLLRAFVEAAREVRARR